MYKTITTIFFIVFLFFFVKCSDIVADDTVIPIYGLLLSPPNELSESQKTFVEFAGYPQQFIKNFGTVNGQERVNETWIYASQGLAELFINGQFVEEKMLSGSDSNLASGKLHPEDYQFGATQENILARHGSPLSIKNDLVWNGSMVIYIYDNVIFGFNNGALTSVIYYTNQ